MMRTVLVYGIIAGLLVGVSLSLTIILVPGHLPPPWGEVIGYTTMLIALSTIFVAIKRRRDIEGGGAIRFWPAFALGLAISLVAGLFYVAAWEIAQAVAGLDFAASYGRMMVEQAREHGASAAELAKVEGQVARFREQYADPLFRLPMTFLEIFPVGVLVSLVSAGLLCNSRFLPPRISASC